MPAKAIVKNKMRKFDNWSLGLLALLAISLFVSCTVLPLNNFQDGRTLGEDNVKVKLAASYSPSFIFNYDSSQSSGNSPSYRVKPNKQQSLAQLELNAGVLQQLDVGFGLYTSFGALGGYFTSKAALFPPDFPLGIALLANAGGGSSWLPDVNSSGNEDYEDIEINFQTLFVALGAPISIHPGAGLGLYFQPKYSYVYNSGRVDMDAGFDVKTSGHKHLNLWGAATGVKIGPFLNNKIPGVALEGSFLKDRNLKWLYSIGAQMDLSFLIVKK